MGNNFSNSKILVTGAGGFIGSHLTETLVQSGASVRALVRYNSRGDTGFLTDLSPDNYKQLEIISGDLRDLSGLHKAMQGVDIVFHLGALIAIPYSYLHPADVVETNVIGTLNVLMAARELGVKKIIHTSTSEVYGTALSVPISESHPLQGQSPYSASKIGADKIVESFYCSYQLPVVTVRPFNTYGPRQSARAVIPTIITQALTQETIKLGSLDTKRDFTFVSDTVNGFLCAASAANVAGKTLNLGVGSDISIKELAEKISLILNKPLVIEADENRLRPPKSEVQRLISDNRLASNLLGWQPQVSLDDGLARTIDWIKKHIDHYDPLQYQI